MATDSFNRADNDALGLAWIEKEDVSSRIRINTNEIQTPSGQGYAIWNRNWTDDQSSKAKLIQLSPTGSMAALAVRLDSCLAAGTMTGYNCRILDLAFASQINRIDAGAFVLIASTAVGAVKLLDTVELKAIGTTISLIRTKGVNWPVPEQGDVDTVASVVDATYANGKAGFSGINSTPGDWARWDDWTGTNIGGPVTPGSACGTGFSGGSEDTGVTSEDDLLALLPKAGWCRN
jgi:hypothetical protein